MSADVYGLNVGEFLPGNDFKASQSESGGWLASQSFTFLEDSLNDTTFTNRFKKGTRLIDLNPSLPDFWSRVYLEKTEVSSQKGPFQTISAHFAGYAGFETNSQNPQPTFPTYALRGGLRSRSIIEHPKVAALFYTMDRRYIQGAIDGYYAWDSVGAVGRIISNDDTTQISECTAVYPAVTEGDALDFFKLASAGDITYDSPTLFWTKSWDSEVGITKAQLALLGKVDDNVDGDPPTETGRDWRLNDAYNEKKGELNRNSLEWELSERGGWNAVKYDFDE